MASLSLCLSLPATSKALTTNFTPRLPSFLKSTTKISPTKPKPFNAVKSSATPATERFISTVAYTLPFFNSLQYGRYFFMQYTNLGLLFDPLVPLLSLYRSVPYANFVAFFALYLGVVRNPSFSHYVWFNSMQAVTLDVLLLVPLLLSRIFNPGRSGIGFKLMIGGTMRFLFSVVLFCLWFSFFFAGKDSVLAVCCRCC